MATRRHGSPAEASSGTPRDRLRRRAVGALWWARSHAYVDLSESPADTVVLLGSARSGTTWVGEVIDRHHDHRLIFEPLRPGAVPAMAAFDRVRYLAPGAAAPAQRLAMQLLLTGRVRNSWADHTNHVVLARRRLVKEIRANCLAPWLAAGFPQCPIVLVVRHPMDVVASRLALGWSDHLDELTSGALPETLTPSVDRVRTWTDPVLRALASWAIETVVPVRGLPAASATITLYEDLRAAPVETFGALLRAIGQSPDAALESAVGRPSRTSRPRTSSATAPGGDLTLTTDQRRIAQELLAELELDTAFDLDDPRPDAAALQRLRPAAVPDVVAPD